MKLNKVEINQIEIVMQIINTAKAHLKEQGIDQWQNGYPDFECIKNDITNEKGYFICDNNDILGYICIDFGGEPAYDTLKGKWSSDDQFVVVHRLALSENARGKNLSNTIFELVQNLSRPKNINYIRVDTDNDNEKMKHILNKNNFKYCGTIIFDNSEKIAFDKIF